MSPIDGIGSNSKNVIFDGMHLLEIVFLHPVLLSTAVSPSGILMYMLSAPLWPARTSVHTLPHLKEMLDPPGTSFYSSVLLFLIDTSSRETFIFPRRQSLERYHLPKGSR
jgi:hypothetical protein